MMDGPGTAALSGVIRAIFIVFISSILLSVSPVKAQNKTCRTRPMDIVFVLDGSRSVRPWHFKSTKDAVKDMVDTIDNIGPDEVQIGLVQYGSIVQQEFDLNQYRTREEINDAIDDVKYMEKGTMTGAALKYLVEYSFTEIHGARTSPDVSKIAVIITDGRAQDPRDVMIWHNKVKNAGIEIFAIGVGRHISDSDLLMLASEPKEKHNFHVESFTLIQNIGLLLKDQICVVEKNECELGEDNCEQLCNDTLDSYTCYCRDGYELEDDGFSCALMLPPAPERLEIDDVTHHSMRVSWRMDKPQMASVIEHYTVTYQPADGSAPPKQVQVTDKEVVLESLDPDTKYNISVRSHGNGEVSDPLEGAETTLALGETTVTLGNPTLTTLQAEWVPAGGDLLTGYSVKIHEVTRVNGKQKFVKHSSTNYGPDVHQMSVEGLEPDTPYRITVLPRHGKLVGGKGTDTASTVRLSPPNVTISKTTLTTAQVNWTGIGFPADTYFVRLVESDSTDADSQQAVLVNGSEHSLLLTGLKPGTDYTAIVSGSVSEAGNLYDSPEGTAEETTKSLVAPEVTIPITTFTTARVEWGDVGADAALFTVHLKHSDDVDGDTEMVQSLRGNIHSTVFTGLTPGQEYTATVVGTVTEGEEEVTSPEGRATGNTLSLVGPNVTIPSTTFTTAKVDWTGIGAEADRFKIVLSSSESSEELVTIATGDERIVLFAGLNPGVTYTAKVTGFVTDDGEELSSPVGTATGTTLSLVAPKVSISNTTFTTAKVDWTGIGAVADGFTVELSRVGAVESQIVVANGNDSSTLFTGLKPGVEYVAKVQGFVTDNGKEVSSPIGSAEGETPSLVAPDVMIPDTTFSTATVVWGLIGTDADAFEVVLSRDDGTEETVITTDGDVHSFKFTGLTPGARYTAKVKGIVVDNGVNIESPPGTAQGETKAVPTPVITVTEVGLSIMDVMWDIRGPVPYEFEVTYHPEDEPDNVQTIATEDLSRRLRDLTPGTKYVVSVKAVYLDGEDKIKSPEANTTETTKTLHAPEVIVLDTTFTTGKIGWSGVGMDVDHWEIKTLSEAVDGPGELRQVDSEQASEETVADLLNLAEANDIEVTGVVVEDGKEFRSPVGLAEILLSSIPPPKVKVTNTSLTTLDAEWVDDIVPDNFVIQITKIPPIPEELLNYKPRPDSVTVDGKVNANQFEDLTPGTEYLVSVWAKVQEGDTEVLSLAGHANDATKPMPPENLDLTEATPATSLEVSFDPPSQGLASSFEVKCVPVGTDPEEIEKIDVDNELANSSKITSCDNLSPGKTYEVWARTVLLSSEEDAPSVDEGFHIILQSFGPYYSEYVKATKTMSLGPVQDFKLIEPTPSSLLATWQPPEFVDEVDHYILRYKPAGSGEPYTEVEVPGDQTSLVLQTLHPDTEYEAEVLPVINSVSGMKSEAVESTLSDIVAIEAVDSTFTSISVEWPISKVPQVPYTIYYAPREEGEGSGNEPNPPESVDVEAGESTTVLTGLKPATTYDITIAYKYQTEPYGMAATVGKTGLPPPGPITFSDVTDTSFVVHWGKPDFGAQPIGYHVRYIGPDGTPVEVDVVGPDNLSLYIDGAIPASLYSFSVAADYGDLSADVTAQVNTTEPAEVCSCSTYIRKQNQMEDSISKLIGVIENLSEKVESLEAAFNKQAEQLLESRRAA